jgi:erythronate-4-phosphate dehydrogenase
VNIVADSFIPYVKECFSSFGEVITFSDRNISSDILEKADALLIRSITKVDKKLLNKSKIKFVGTATTGYDHVDRKYLSERNIGFASAPGANSNSVAEYVIAAILNLAEKYQIQLNCKSIGIIGVGNIGSKVEKKAKALGMKVFLNDPPLQRKTGDKKYLPLEEIYNCDFITFHTPLIFEGRDKTYHLANSAFFDNLKGETFFLNTSRGSVMETHALKQTIKEGKIKGSVLDVWEDEPNIDDELLQMVDIASPHIAGLSLDGKVNGMIKIYRVFCDYFGFNTEKTKYDFLPKSEIPEFIIDHDYYTEQELINQVISQVYNINSDELNSGRFSGVPKDERAKYFDNLRNNYPIRREFYNTKLIMKKPINSLLNNFSEIGFTIE